MNSCKKTTPAESGEKPVRSLENKHETAIGKFRQIAILHGTLHGKKLTGVVTCCNHRT